MRSIRELYFHGWRLLAYSASCRCHVVQNGFLMQITSFTDKALKAITAVILVVMYGNGLISWEVFHSREKKREREKITRTLNLARLHIS